MDSSPRTTSPMAAAATFSSRGCCSCFYWERIRISGDRTRLETGRRWWRSSVEALMKVREWSEIVAGPKWKTFIRRFNRRFRNGGGGSGNGRGFGYDPLSYSLNFDGGNGDNPEMDLGHDDFSTRFVTPGPGNSLMDLGPPPPVAAAR